MNTLEAATDRLSKEKEEARRAIANLVIEDPDTLLAYHYVDLYEFAPLRGEKKPSLMDVAAQLKMHHQALSRHVKLWEGKGLLQKIRRALLIPFEGQIEMKEFEVYSKWGDVLDRVFKIATEGKSEQFAIMAAQFLEEKVIQRVRDRQTQSSDAELEFLANYQEVNPFLIAAKVEKNE